MLQFHCIVRRVGRGKGSQRQGGLRSVYPEHMRAGANFARGQGPTSATDLACPPPPLLPPSSCLPAVQHAPPAAACPSAGPGSGGCLKRRRLSTTAAERWGSLPLYARDGSLLATTPEGHSSSCNSPTLHGMSRAPPITRRLAPLAVPCLLYILLRRVAHSPITPAVSLRASSVAFLSYYPMHCILSSYTSRANMKRSARQARLCSACPASTRARSSRALCARPASQPPMDWTLYCLWTVCCLVLDWYVTIGDGAGQGHAPQLGVQQNNKRLGVRVHSGAGKTLIGKGGRGKEEKSGREKERGGKGGRVQSEGSPPTCPRVPAVLLKLRCSAGQTRGPAKMRGAEDRRLGWAPGGCADKKNWGTAGSRPSRCTHACSGQPKGASTHPPRKNGGRGGEQAASGQRLRRIALAGTGTGAGLASPRPTASKRCRHVRAPGWARRWLASRRRCWLAGWLR